jgi:Protein of unknown function (DUF4435)
VEKFEVDELLNLAIMSKTPYYIVEGVDDICIYERIAESASIECEVYSIDMISGMTGGNNAIISAMQSLENLPMPGTSKVHHFITGIVDRDARPYRNEMPTLQSILCLNFYSIESHFASEHSIKPAITKLTRISQRDQVSITDILSTIESQLSNLYYFSLDALKGATTPTYSSTVGFSTNVGRRKDGNTIAQIATKASELDAFAASHHLTNSLTSMREFAKGKWLLTAFSEELFTEICDLKTKCKSAIIQRCRMCAVDADAACLFTLRDGFTKTSLYSTILDFVESPDFDYIRDRMSLVASTTRN